MALINEALKYEDPGLSPVTSDHLAVSYNTQAT